MVQLSSFSLAFLSDLSTFNIVIVLADPDIILIYASAHLHVSIANFLHVLTEQLARGDAELESSGQTVRGVRKRRGKIRGLRSDDWRRSL
jgi:hypothetical protein